MTRYVVLVETLVVGVPKELKPPPGCLDEEPVSWSAVDLSTDHFARTGVLSVWKKKDPG